MGHITGDGVSGHGGGSEGVQFWHVTIGGGGQVPSDSTV